METSNKVKYPKTPHLHFSLGLMNDDKMMPTKTYNEFCKFNVVGTEKMDGESFTVYRHTTHARSLDSGDHPSRSYSKMYAATFQHLIPVGWRFCFENCYAQHSIFYERLDTYCFLLNIWDSDNYCLSWQETQKIANDLGLVFPSIEYFGKYNETEVKHVFLSQDHRIVEGLVLRNVERFHYNDFAKNYAKLVRKGHVQTDEHWMNKPVIKNLLKT